MALNTVQTIDDRVRVRTALVSVWDKTGLPALVSGLLSAAPGLRILSTGGTHDAIRHLLGEKAAGTLQQVSDYTGQPEMQGGLVKTLDFRIYLGLLSETYNASHQDDLRRTGALPIDLVVVNLYPFRQSIAQTGATPESARGNIDIGGPCMVRAAAKNFHRVAVVVDPGDYEGLVRELSEHGGALSLETRFTLARKAFEASAAYDRAIADYLGGLAFPTVRGTYTVKAGA